MAKFVPAAAVTQTRRLINRSVKRTVTNYLKVESLHEEVEFIHGLPYK